MNLIFEALDDDEPLPRPPRWGLAAALVMLLAVCAAACCGAERVVHTVFGDTLPPAQADDAIFATHLYVAAVDRETRLPRWVAYRVYGAGQFGDNEIGRNWHSPVPEVLLEESDYNGSGFDMGHLAPLAAFRASPHASELNWTCNIIPQSPELNRGLWSQLESQIRGWSLQHEQVDVVCGPLYEKFVKLLPACDENHRVPSHCWKRVAYGPSRSVRTWIFPQEIPAGSKLHQFEVHAEEFANRVAKGLP